MPGFARLYNPVGRCAGSSTTYSGHHRDAREHRWTSMIDAAPLPVSSPRRSFSARVIGVDNALCGAARSRHIALCQRGIAALEVIVREALVNLQADRVSGIIGLGECRRCRQNRRHRQNRQSQNAHQNLPWPYIHGPTSDNQCRRPVVPENKPAQMPVPETHRSPIPAKWPISFIPLRPRSPDTQTRRLRDNLRSIGCCAKAPASIACHRVPTTFFCA